MSSPKQASTYSEPEYAKSDRKKTDYPWYLPSIDKHLLPEVRAIKCLNLLSSCLRDYSSREAVES